MSEPSLETQSVLHYALSGTSRLCAYAHHAKRQGLTYRQFVDVLECARRDVMKTPDGVLMNPESNDKLDLKRLMEGWRALDVADCDTLFEKS